MIKKKKKKGKFIEEFRICSFPEMKSDGWVRGRLGLEGRKEKKRAWSDKGRGQRRSL